MAYADERGRREKEEPANPIAPPVEDNQPAPPIVDNRPPDRTLPTVPTNPDNPINPVPDDAHRGDEDNQNQDQNNSGGAEDQPQDQGGGEENHEPTYEVPKEEQQALDAAKVWEPHYTFDDDTGEATLTDASQVTQPAEQPTVAQPKAGNMTGPAGYDGTVPSRPDIDYQQPKAEEPEPAPIITTSEDTGTEAKTAGQLLSRQTEEDEDDFWSGGNPLREAIDRVNSGDLRTSDVTMGGNPNLPRPVYGNTAPTGTPIELGPAPTRYDVDPTLLANNYVANNGTPTRDELLAGISTLLNPIAGLGAKPALAESEYTPTPTGASQTGSADSPLADNVYGTIEDFRALGASLGLSGQELEDYARDEFMRANGMGTTGRGGKPVYVSSENSATDENGHTIVVPNKASEALPSSGGSSFLQDSEAVQNLTGGRSLVQLAGKGMETLYPFLLDTNPALSYIYPLYGKRPSEVIQDQLENSWGDVIVPGAGYLGNALETAGDVFREGVNNSIPVVNTLADAGLDFVFGKNGGVRTGLDIVNDYVTNPLAARTLTGITGETVEPNPHPSAGERVDDFVSNAEERWDDIRENAEEAADNMSNYIDQLTADSNPENPDNPVNPTQYYTTEELYREAEEAALRAGYRPEDIASDRFIENYVRDARDKAAEQYVQTQTETRLNDAVSQYIDNMSAEDKVKLGLADWDKMTDEQKRIAANNLINPIANYTDQEGNVYFDLDAAKEGLLPDGYNMPGHNEDGSWNPAMQAVVNAVRFYDKNGVEVFRNPNGSFSYADGKAYKDAPASWRSKYTPEDIMSLYVNSFTGDNGDTWRGMEWIDNLPEKEQAGMRELLAKFVGGGDPYRERSEGFKQEFADLTPDEFDKLYGLFLKNMPELNYLLQQGYLDGTDENGNVVKGSGAQNLVNFFFKALKQQPQKPKGNNNNSKGGYRSYSRGGGGGRRGGGGGSRSYSGFTNHTNIQTPSRGGGGISYGGSSGGGYSQGPNIARPTEPNQANQKTNRVYNIMKNWSF